MNTLNKQNLSKLLDEQLNGARVIKHMFGDEKVIESLGIALAMVRISQDELGLKQEDLVRKSDEFIKEFKESK